MRGDSWHCGLKIGMQGLPRLNELVSTTWMLNADADSEIECTSWRLTLRAALIDQRVIEQIGFLRPEFESLDGASLELGHRYISRGVLLRHVPTLCPSVPALAPSIPVFDEARYLHFRFGKFWSRWGLARAAVTGRISIGSFWKCLSLIRKLPVIQKYPAYHERVQMKNSIIDRPLVTVLIPTLDRYPYLRKLLTQIREQTIRAHEVIVIDQTPLEQRDSSIAEEFQDLPLKVIYRKEPGQCSSRNEGILAASGEYLLLLDDDLEIKPDLTELHLRNLNFFDADASCGVAEEAGAGALPEHFRMIRASDVFPGGNTLVRMCALRESGLFDAAYDFGPRADGDLGTRIYLSGALIVMNHNISVFHHHAPSGGLRTHKGRVITYASSRMQLKQRHLPAVTEIYLGLRYHSKQAVKEMLWIRAIGTFSMKGTLLKKILKIVVAGVLLPDTILEIRKRRKQAEEMLTRYPKIPALQSEPRVQVEY
jgi:glycosyltransferase involved in cell wall biosynthesis